MGLICRRCSGDIGEDEVANLVAVRPSGYQLTSEMDRCIIVCGDCLDVNEKGYQERPYAYSAPPKPELVIPEHMFRLMEQVAAGRVYRRPRRILWADPDTGTNKAITDKGYLLLKMKLAKWEVVPPAQQVPNGPNAWMRLTETGVGFLERGNLVSA